MTSVTSMWTGGKARAGSMLLLVALAAACSEASGGGTGGDATGGGGASSSSGTVATTSSGPGVTTTGTSAGGDDGAGGDGGGEDGAGGADGACLSNDDCIPSQYCHHGWGYPECSPASVPGSSWCVDRAESCDPDGGRPVCGCDGRVYASSCEASMAGVVLDATNACTAPAGSFDCRQTFCDAGAVCVIERDGDDVTPRCEPLPEACGAGASCGCVTSSAEGTDCTCEGDGCACEAALGAFCDGGFVDDCLGDGSAGFTLDCNPEP